MVDPVLPAGRKSACCSGDKAEWVRFRPIGELSVPRPALNDLAMSDCCAIACPVGDLCRFSGCLIRAAKCDNGDAPIGKGTVADLMTGEDA